jgi:hypothetical protein
VPATCSLLSGCAFCINLSLGVARLVKKTSLHGCRNAAAIKTFVCVCAAVKWQQYGLQFRDFFSCDDTTGTTWVAGSDATGVGKGLRLCRCRALQLGLPPCLLCVTKRQDLHDSLGRACEPLICPQSNKLWLWTACDLSNVFMTATDVAEGGATQLTFLHATQYACVW